MSYSLLTASPPLANKSLTSSSRMSVFRLHKAHLDWSFGSPLCLLTSLVCFCFLLSPTRSHRFMPVVKVPMMELMRVARMKVFYDGNELLDSTTEERRSG